jgi:hypothetical protein
MENSYRCGSSCGGHFQVVRRKLRFPLSLYDLILTRLLDRQKQMDYDSGKVNLPAGSFSGPSSVERKSPYQGGGTSYVVSICFYS